IAALDPESQPAEVTQVTETELAELSVPKGGRRDAPLKILITTEAARSETRPRLLWSLEPPLVPMETRYGQTPISEVDGLPSTGPLLLAEYDWPSRWLLVLWLFVAGWAVFAIKRGPAAWGGVLVGVALAASVSSALLWQRDYTRRAPHLDADGYAESAEQMARFIADPDQRPRVAAWFRAYPHATTQLLPALLVPWVLLGIPASYAYMLLSALACWLALLGIRRVGLDGLGFSEPLAVGLALAFACHPLVLRTFARPITDGLGLLLVIWTLWLLIRRLKGPGIWDEAWLALLVLAHPLARPQGFAYWPFIAVAVVVADRVRRGTWPRIDAILASACRIFLPAVCILAILYWQFDWWHNVDLMLAKARRFRIDSTLRAFIDSCLGLILLLPLLFFFRPTDSTRRRTLDPSLALLVAWVLYAVATLVAVRAPFWLRHFLPALPAIYWLAGAWVQRLGGRRRRVAAGILAAGAAIGVAVTLRQIAFLEPLPVWYAGIVAVP
ncbi:hypothetical protein MK280_12230, partial [Myxococcota bacterium]|nr:hypothetical protein [Myxococcota bacterium]